MNLPPDLLLSLLALLTLAVLLVLRHRATAERGELTLAARDGGSASFARARLSLAEAAYLSGGAERVADAVMAERYRAGQLRFRNGRSRPHGPRLRAKDAWPSPHDAFRYKVYQIAAAGGAVADARRALEQPASAIRLDLLQRGLALGRTAQMRRNMGYAVLCVLALAQVAVAHIMQSPIHWLAGIVALATAVNLWSGGYLIGRGAFAPALTRAGKRALVQIRQTWQDTERPPIDPVSPMGWAWTCALYGVRALPDEPAAKLQAALLYNKGDRWRPVVGGEDEAAGAHGAGGGGR